MDLNLGFNIELDYTYLAEILIIIYIYLYISYYLKGNLEHNYLQRATNVKLKKNLFSFFYDIFDYIIFYFLAYLPFLGLFRWNNYYSNRLKEKFRYNLRINHIIYKYDFVYNDEEKDFKVKGIFNYLFKKWLINFSYLITIYAIYIKIIIKFFFFLLLILYYLLLNLILFIINLNLWSLYIYDIIRYIIYLFQIIIFKRINKKIINKLWIYLDYFKIEFIYLIYNIPYFFFLSLIVTIFNHINVRFFSFYNRFKFENKSDDNIIPYNNSMKNFFFLI